MVNKYLKAMALTLILLAGGLIVTKYIDDERVKSVASTLDDATIEVQVTEQLLLYESVFPGKEVCPVLMKRIDLQLEKTRTILGELEAAQKQSIVADFELSKKKYLNNNIGLFLLVEKASRTCASTIKPVLFFYSDKVYCADCIAQGKILDQVRDECNDVRVFAFPSDLGLPIVELLKARNGIQDVPAIVLGDKKLDGLSVKEKVKKF